MSDKITVLFRQMTKDSAFMSLVGFTCGFFLSTLVLAVPNRQAAESWISYAESLKPMPVDVSALTSTGEYRLPASGFVPDEQHRGDVRTLVEFVAPDKVAARCGQPAMACGGYPVVMPNPCHFLDDPYSRMLCHEIGHVNGWSHPVPAYAECKPPLQLDACLRGEIMRSKQ